MAKKPKYIFVVGGVMSGVGKGVATSSIGKILQARGFEVTALKIDPYVNVDAGTMNPTEHGEVFVLSDGTECDQDMGNYERFLNRELSGLNYMTTGSIYLSVINRERNLEYAGKCVSVVPHIPLEIISRFERAARSAKADIVITEVGGTVGEYQNILFLEAIRMLKVRHPGDVLVVLVSYVPTLGAGGTELKTKPTQYAARSLNSAGLQADIIIARAARALDTKRKEKIAENCNIREKDVISAPDISNIYEVPLNFEKDNLSTIILEKLGVKPRKTDLKEWRKFVEKTNKAKIFPSIAIVGKYFGSGDFVLTDSYLSVLEAIKHAGAALGVKPKIEWIDAAEFEKQPSKLKELSSYSGVLVPGGFGSRGVEGKIAAIRYCREKKIPYFGLCYGMQLAVIEFARTHGFPKAHTTEIDPETKHPVIDILPEQKKNIEVKNYGATMRLGTYSASIRAGTIAREAYGSPRIKERHRHRYEVNPEYLTRLEKKGLVFSGMSPDRRLAEITELPKEKHPFFLGTQFHPELTSRPLDPNPLFVSFLSAATKNKRN
ncbi:MAG: CTP synthase [Patescibacteria group bacterium]